jgi:hypothetical protein
MLSELDESTKKELLQMLQEGNLIHAIKIYRRATNQGLKESKDVIDALYAKLRQEDPVTYPDRKAGCAMMLLLAVTLLTGSTGGLLGLLLSL